MQFLFRSVSKQMLGNLEELIHSAGSASSLHPHIMIRYAPINQIRKSIKLRAIVFISRIQIRVAYAEVSARAILDSSQRLVKFTVACCVIVCRVLFQF